MINKSEKLAEQTPVSGSASVQPEAVQGTRSRPYVSPKVVTHTSESLSKILPVSACNSFVPIQN